MTLEEIEHFNADDFKSNAEGLRGSGSFGKVFLCKHKKLDFVAVKCFTLCKNSNLKDKIDKEFRRETKLLWNADHRNVVKTHGYVQCDDFYGIVMEYAACKNLQSLIFGRKKDITYSYQLSLHILKEITDGLHYLHTLDKPLVHGDLKPDNILLSDGLQVKIADLGSARHPSTISIASRKDFGTPGYIAPERYSSEAAELKPAVDIFSFAVTAFHLIKREEVVVNQWHARDARDQRPGDLNDIKEKESDTESKVILLRLNDMIKSCWDKVPTKRWSTKDINEKLTDWIDGKLKQKVAKEAADIAEKLKFPPYNEGIGEMCLEDCFDLTRNYNEPCMIVTGGQATKQDVIAFTSKKYSILPSLREGRCHHCSVIVEKEKKNEERKVQSRLYVLGGVNKGKVLKSVEYLELKKNLVKLESWKPAKDMIECRFLACAETLNDKIYVVGGKNESDEILDTIECFSIDDEQWSLVSALKLTTKRFAFNTFLHNDFIYCCGGLDPHGKVTHTLEKINPKLMKQETMTRKQNENRFTRYSACTVKVDETAVWFIGGLNKNHKAAEPSVVKYKVNDSWQSLEKSIEIKRCSFAAAMADRTIYVLGGHNLNNSISSMSSYEQIDLTKKTKWSLSSMSNHPDPNASEKLWAGHTMVPWKPGN